MPITLPVGEHRPSGVTGRHVLIAVIAFFSAIFAVNGLLLWQAIATHSGVVAVEPYRKGLAYNERIVADTQQKMLGWSDIVTVEGGRRVTLTLTDSAGRPVGGLVASGTIGRPSTTSHDRRLTFIEQASGSYVALVEAIVEPGTWLVSIDASAAGTMQRAGGDASAATVYRLKRRLWVKH
jgi:nitrogen fixation protein FixH